jgi:hypothetical protein
LIIKSTLALNGLVSMAVIKIFAGIELMAGTLLNGRVLKLVHKPELTNWLFI